MESNPGVPGGLLTSKPTWSNTFGSFATSAFLFSEIRNRPQEASIFWSSRNVQFEANLQAGKFPLVLNATAEQVQRAEDRLDDTQVVETTRK